MRRPVIEMLAGGLSVGEIENVMRDYLGGFSSTWGRRFSFTWSYGYRLGFTTILLVSIVLIGARRLDDTNALKERQNLENTRLSFEIEKLREEIAQLRHNSANPAK